MGVLAYSIVMLTTNLHSSKVKSKMEKHQFIKQNAGVNGGSNFPGDFLSQIYDDIRQEELKVMRPLGCGVRSRCAAARWIEEVHGFLPPDTQNRIQCRSLVEEWASCTSATTAFPHLSRKKSMLFSSLAR